VSGFSLDTSGTVRLPPGERTSKNGRVLARWSDLSPFAQGYIPEAIKAAVLARWPELCAVYGVELVAQSYNIGFSDLAPATLAEMLKDCAWWTDQWPLDLTRIGHGRWIWEARQRNEIKNFRPLHLFLNNEGKICSEVKS
jgi:hypothetical protein